jgi:hypothetical protein
MAKGYEVMEMLCPQGGWILIADDFDSITWVDDRPRCTKAEYEAGFAQYDAWKAEQEATKATAKAAAEAKLGSTWLDSRRLKSTRTRR